MIVQNSSIHFVDHNLLGSSLAADPLFTQISTERIWGVVGPALDWAGSQSSWPHCKLEDRDVELAGLMLPKCPLLDFNFTELSRASTGFFGPYRHFDLPYLNLIKNEDHEWLTAMDHLMGNPNNFQMVFEGTSGSYWIKDEAGQRVALFKFNDEATGQPKNPKGFSEGGFDSEKAAEREFAAWLIGGKLAGVPEAHVIDVFHNDKVRRGCLIKFVEADGTVGDLYRPFTGNILELAGLDTNKNLFELLDDAETSKKIQNLLQDRERLSDNVRSNHETKIKIIKRFGEIVCRIAILDILIGNFDRANPANILYKESSDGKIEFFPIDHNMAFTEVLSSQDFIFENPPFWMDALYFTSASLDAEGCRYVENLDLEALARHLEVLGLSESRIQGVQLRGLLLKKGIQAGLSLFETVQMMMIEDEDVDIVDSEPIFRSCIAKLIEKTHEVLKGEEVPKEEKFQRGFEIFGSLLNEEIAVRKEQIERQGESDQVKYEKEMEEAYMNFVKKEGDSSKFEAYLKRIIEDAFGEEDV